MLRRHRFVLAYVVLVLGVAVALGVRQNQVDNDFRIHDQRSCEQRNALAANQVHALHAIAVLLDLESQEGRHTAFESGSIKSQLREVRAALKVAGPREC